MLYKHIEKSIVGGTRKMSKRNFTKYPTAVESHTDLLTSGGLSKLIRDTWIEVNQTWGNSEDDLADWEDALYSDISYRFGLAEYVHEHYPDVASVQLDVDEDSSEIIVIVLDKSNQSLGKVKAWYARGRYGFECM